MINTVSNKENRNCCGCGLCEVLCPVGALSLKHDKEGFAYPMVDGQKCIGCKRCLNCCSFTEEFVNNYSKKINTSYIARCYDKDVLKNSASGGIFSILSDEILQDGGSVYGATFDTSFMVRHTCAKTKEDRNRQRGSKYVQSDISHIFRSVDDDLKNGLQVLFTGTPCQIAAIIGFLKNINTNTDRLLTCDIICHGVCSPMIWEKYLDYIKDTYGTIKNINFRDKKYGSGYNMTIETNSGLYHKDENQDPFIKIFELNYALRPSCFNCVMKTTERLGNISIGDFQKAKQYFPDYEDGEGVSVVLVNSKKGKNFFEIIKNELEFKECLLELAMQPNLYMQIKRPNERENFFYLCSQKPFIDVMKKYTELGTGNHVIGYTKRLIKKILKRCKFGKDIL